MASMMMTPRELSSGLVTHAATRGWCQGGLADSTPGFWSFQLPRIQNPLPSIIACSLSSDQPSRRRVSPNATKTIRRSPQAPRRNMQDDGDFESLERKMLEKARHATILDRRIFETEAASGRVECSNRGCRPIYEDSLQLDEHFQWPTWNARPPSGIFNTIPSHLVSDYFASDTAIDLKEAFEQALQDAPGNAQLLSEFASFTWKAMKDSDGAEKLYNEALGVSPDDSNLLASHAHFLWQNEE